jgi:hypothetical protein
VPYIQNLSTCWWSAACPSYFGPKKRLPIYFQQKMNALQNCHICKMAKGEISKDSGLLGCYRVIVSSHFKNMYPEKFSVQ